MKRSMLSKMNPGLLRRLYRLLWVGLLLTIGVGSRAQTVSFNFSAVAETWPGWVNVAGDPSMAVQTATANGITISSVSTSNWVPYSGIAAGNTGSAVGGYFPPRVMANNWFQYNGTGFSLALYNAMMPQIALTGLNPDSTYILRMSGSDGGSFPSNPTLYTVAGATTYATQSLNVHNDSVLGVIFQGITPDATGKIRIYVNATSSTEIASICGIQVYPGNSGVGSPAVAITSPANGTTLPEDGNVIIKATATEAGATISKVEFYADTTKIGEVDTVPYNFTWVDPDPGTYTVTAKATDNSGTINNAMISIGIKSLNYFWSTTGNVGNNADSTFVGNVDSVRLDFRTKDIQRMSILPTGNIGIGTIAPTAQFHTTGSVRLAGLKLDSSSVDPRMIVSDTNGNLAYRAVGGGGGMLTVGPGLGQTPGGAIALGDTVSGSGPHSFTSNRYEYLNGFQYSFGGSVNDPVNMPNFLIYDNGDLAAGTTMNRSVNTLGQTGMRYYSKLGVMQLGGSDRLDTTQSKIVYGIWPGSGLLINSDTANTMKGKLMNTVFVGENNVFDSLSFMENCIIAAGGSLFAPGSGNMDKVIVLGYGNSITAPVNTTLISGVGNTIAQPLSVDVITGKNNIARAPANGVFVTGAYNQYGAVAQFLAGQNLVNRVAFAATLGNANVDFPSIPYDSLAGTVAPGQPLFALGNSSTADSSIRSNAWTVLYNGRTQINTTGYTSALNQTAVTPKAALEVVSTNTGVLLPKLTTTQRNAIATGDLQNGLLLYNTDSSAFQFYNGTAWASVGGNGVNIAEWGAAGNAGTNPASNFIGTTDNERLVFRTADTERMTILANGAVGIGTSTLPASDAQLAVNGTIYTTKVKVTQIGWPDYVFEKGYSLPSLLSVERFIHQHRHLPGIISADEAAAKRVDLGDNQAALLQKVEELTLYLLEEHKKAEAEEKEIERLKAQNKLLDDQQKEIDQLKEVLRKLTEKTN